MEAPKAQTPPRIGLTTKQAMKLAVIPVGLAFVLSLQPATLLHSSFDFFFHGSSVLTVGLICFILFTGCLIGASQCVLPVATAPIENRQQYFNINKSVLKKAIILSSLPFVAIIFYPSFFLFDVGVFLLLMAYGFLLIFSTSFFMSAEIKRHPSLANRQMQPLPEHQSIYDRFPGSELFYSPASPLYSVWDRYKT